MNTLKKLFLILPEYVLVASALYYWYATLNMYNPIAIGLITILVLQIIFKNKISGIILSCIIMILSLFMVFAVLSEFYEFPTFSDKSKQFLIIGLLYFLSTLFVSLIMLFKYATLPKKPNRSIV